MWSSLSGGKSDHSQVCEYKLGHRCDVNDNITAKEGVKECCEESDEMGFRKGVKTLAIITLRVPHRLQ